MHSKYFFDRLAKIPNANIIKFNDICDNYEKASEAGIYFSTKNLDLLIYFVSTYSPSVNTTAVVQKVGEIPVIVVGLQPNLALDYKKGTTADQLENDTITSLPEIMNALYRMGRKHLDCIVGFLYNDTIAWNKIENWIEVASVAHSLKRDHIGLLGHVYEGMLDMNSDPTMFEAYFGMHIEHLEMEDLEILIEQTSNLEIEERIKDIKDIFDLPEPGADPITAKVSDRDLEWSAKVAVGMDKLILNFKLTGLSYYYRGLNSNNFEKIHAGMIVGNSILTSKGIAIAGELDLKNCIAMLIMDRFGAGGSFAELHPIDFEEDFVLVGHDGPHHLTIADGKPVLRKLSVLHGKRGWGPSVEYKIKVGPITMLGLTQTFDGKFKMVVTEGESLPGLIPATGNTNTRGKFKPNVITFLEKWAAEGPTHHFALGIGHIAKKIEMLAKYFNIECVLVAPENS